MGLEILRPTTSTGGWTNPANAYDTSDTTYAISLTGDSTEVWSGWSTATETYTALDLKITWEIVGDNNDDLDLEYSLNSGSTWETPIRSGDGATTAKATTTITLSAGQDLTQIQVRGSKDQQAPFSGSTNLYIYEIWTEGTFAGATSVTVEPTIMTSTFSVGTPTVTATLNYVIVEPTIMTSTFSVGTVTVEATTPVPQIWSNDTDPFSDSSCIHMYPFDTDYNDDAGTAHGTNVGCTLTTGDGGVFDEAVVINASSDAVDVPLTSYTWGDMLSFSFNLKMTAITDTSYLFQAQHTATSGGWIEIRYQVTSKSLAFYSVDDTNVIKHYALGNTDKIDINTWHRCVVNVIERANDPQTEVQFFVDGVDIGMNTSSYSATDTVTTGGAVHIGGHGYTDLPTAGFMLDHFRIYDRRLTSDEALGLANERLVGSGVDVTATPTVSTATLTVGTASVILDFGVDVTPSVVEGTFTVGTPTVSVVAHRTIVDTGVTGTLTTNTATATGGSLVTAEPVTASFVVLDPFVGGVVIIYPTVATATLTVNEATPIGNSIFTDTGTTATWSVNEATPIVGNVKTVDTGVTATWEVNNPTVYLNASVIDTGVTATWSVGEVFVASIQRVEPEVVTITTSVNDVTVTGSAVHTDTATVGTFTVNTPTVYLNALFEDTGVVTTFTVNAPTILDGDAVVFAMETQLWVKCMPVSIFTNGEDVTTGPAFNNQAHLTKMRIRRDAGYF